MAKKQRFTLTATALTSYFGIGFNTPNEQIQYDLGNEEQVFDDAAQARMDLGNCLEDGALDYFEKQLNVKIIDRNENIKEVLNGTLRTKNDGRIIVSEDTVILGHSFKAGEEIIVENKISNAQSGVFTENKGYQLQCQCYFIEDKADYALLCGIYQGKPVMKLISRDEQTQKDIVEMVNFIQDVLIGLDNFENYPTHILERHAKEVVLQAPLMADESDVDLFKEYADFNNAAKEAKKHADAIKAQILSKFDNGVFENDDVKFSIAERSRKGGFDEIALSIAHPEIDLSEFRKPSSTYSVVTSKLK